MTGLLETARAEAEAPAEPSKICKKCKIDKPLTEYYFVGIASDRPAPTVRRRLSACKSCCSNYSRNQHRKKKYALTPEQVQEKIDAQDGRCMICQCPITVDDCAIDHDHECCPGKYSCGKCVRDALCQGCNHGIGHFGDDPVRLEFAARYVEHHRARLATSVA